MGIRILIFIIGLGLGWICIRYNLKIVEILGKSAWVENKMTGGTYSMWKLIGLLLIIAGILTLLGAFNFLFESSAS